MTTEKPSVTKRFYEVVFPAMVKDGFIRLNTTMFVRSMEDQILQWVHVYVRTVLKREYFVEYGTMLLSQPHECFVKTLGGDFKKGTSGGTYGAQHDKMLELSIERVLIAYQIEAYPVLSKSASIQGFINSYEEMFKASPALCQSGHEDFTLACAYGVRGDTAHALSYCEASKNKYNKAYTDHNGRDWAKAGFDHAENLKNDLIATGTSPLLQQWRKQTIDQLKLHKLCNP